MSVEFPTLAEVLAEHRPYGLDCQCGRAINSDVDWAHHTKNVWREVCTIRTAEQLDALPRTSIVLDADQVVVRRDPWGEFSTVKWFPLDSTDSFDRDMGLDADEVNLPALLIHHPDWSGS